MCYGAIYLPLIPYNDIEGTLFIFFGVSMVGGATHTAFNWSVAVLILFWAEIVRLATCWGCPVPALWRWLIPMAIILNDKILLDSFLQYVVAKVQKLYYMLPSLYGVYDFSSSYNKTYWSSWIPKQALLKQ